LFLWSFLFFLIFGRLAARKGETAGVLGAGGKGFPQRERERERERRGEERQ
jgi:hypothetical protein